MRVENPASSPPASPPVRTSRNFSALRAAAPAAGTSAPRAKLLWKKVRDNRLADNGERPVEGAAAEQSRFWRLQNGASAFLFGVDKDVDGRRKNRAEKVMKRVNQLSKRSKFARSSEFDEELKQLRAAHLVPDPSPVSRQRPGDSAPRMDIRFRSRSSRNGCYTWSTGDRPRTGSTRRRSAGTNAGTGRQSRWG
jgi:hypothetical protein